MDALIETFHLDVKLIVAQMVNFAIVAIVLWFGAVKPLLKIMTERTNTIEKGLADAKAAQIRVEEAGAAYESALQQARREADDLLASASTKSQQERAEAIAKTKTEVERIVKAGKDQLAAEKVAMISSAQRDVLDLVLAVVHRTLGEGMSKDIDRKVIDRALRSLATENKQKQS